MSGPRGRGTSPAGAQATIEVRVTPRSARDEVAEFSLGVYRIRLTAPPVEDRANEALVRFLARALDVPRRRVELLSGERGRRKVVRVDGLTPAEVMRRLAPPSEQPAD